MQTRRGIISGLISLVAAPAIIRVNHLMPVYTHKEVAVPIIIDIEADWLWPYQVTMIDGIMIEDQQRINEARKYIRSISHFT